MTKEEREAFDKNWADQAEKNVAALAAAWIKDNQPAAGENGAACGEEGACPDGQCCGYSVPKPKQKTITLESNSDNGKAADESGVAAIGGLLDLAGALPVEGEIKNICIKSSSKDEGIQTEWKNGLNEEYVHTCMAKKLAATAAATIAVAFSMM